MAGSEGAGAPRVVEMGVGDEDPIETDTAKRGREERSAAGGPGVDERGSVAADKVRGSRARLAKLVDIE
jgi:hypothetical protein